MPERGSAPGESSPKTQVADAIMDRKLNLCVLSEDGAYFFASQVVSMSVTPISSTTLLDRPMLEQDYSLKIGEETLFITFTVDVFQLSL